MSAEVAIKVMIASRPYPLIIKPEEEENVLKAAKLIEGRMKELEETYSIKDKQDLLAMCALQFATLANAAEKKPYETGEVEQLHMLDEMLTDYLQQDTTLI